MFIYRVALLLVAVVSAGAKIRPTLIRGSEVDPSKWKQVVVIKSGSYECTATVVGPRVILAAAHCAASGATATFSVDGKSYSATMTQSPQFATRDHDIGLGVTSTEITGITPMSIGGVPSVGQEITLMGYGCTQTDHSGSDGKLRTGSSQITAVSTDRFSSTTPTGALLCPGDSGGPAYTESGGKLLVVGVNSAVGINNSGTIVGPNHLARLDGAEHQAFIKKVATDKGVDICGVTKQCSGQQPPPSDPTCQLTAVPSTVKEGDSLTLQISTTNAVQATIDGVPVSVPTGSRNILPAASNTAFGSVTGGTGKTGSCSTTYTVTPKDSPGVVSCTLTAIPGKVKVNENVTLELQGSGTIDYGSIDGAAVAVPLGRRVVAPKTKGDYSAVGFVKGTGGSANCYANYRVDDGGAAPVGPNYTLTPTYCGSDSNSASTSISKVCLGVFKKDSTVTHTGFTQGVAVKYNDGTEELLPIIAKRPLGSSKDELGLFANGVVAGASGATLDARMATLTKGTDGSPTQIEGRTKSGKNFRATLSPQ